MNNQPSYQEIKRLLIKEVEDTGQRYFYLVSEQEGIMTDGTSGWGYCTQQGKYGEVGKQFVLHPLPLEQKAEHKQILDEEIAEKVKDGYFDVDSSQYGGLDQEWRKRIGI